MRGILFAVAALAVAQETDVPVFRTGVSVVKVDARVSSGAGDIAGLTAADFLVYDEGQPQKINEFARESQPVSVLMLLDVSPSMRRTLSDVAVKSVDALGSLRPGDSAAVMLFAERSSVVQPFSSDVKAIPKVITDSIFKDTHGRTTLLNEALVAASEYMRKSAPPGRRALLVVTDNQALRGQVADDAVVRSLHAADAVLNAIVIGEPAGRDDGPGRYSDPASTPPDVLRYATTTGGAVSSGSNPGQALVRFLAQSVTRYSLHYTSPGGAPGSFRNIKVELAPSAKRKYPDATVQARSGYNVAQ